MIKEKLTVFTYEKHKGILCQTKNPLAKMLFIFWKYLSYFLTENENELCIFPHYYYLEINVCFYFFFGGISGYHFIIFNNSVHIPQRMFSDELSLSLQLIVMGSQALLFFLSGEAAKFLDTSNDIKVNQGHHLTYLLKHYRSDKSY